MAIGFSNVGASLHVLRAVALFGGSAGLVGCGSIEPVAPHELVTDPARLYARLTLDHPAINLSTAPGYNTRQLTATPRDALGNGMLGLPAPTFKSLDPTRVQVTADGLVTAVGVASAPGIPIVAELTIPGPVRHVDTAYVQVTSLEDPPPLVSLSIQPAPADSAIWSWSSNSLGAFMVNILLFAGIGNTVPEPRAMDPAGSAISGLIYEYVSLDPTVATFDRWTSALTTFSPGQVRRVARTNAYGIAKADTATYMVTMPIAVDIGVSRSGFDRPDVRIAPHGFVMWLFNPPAGTSDSVDIVFDEPANVAAPSGTVCDVLGLFGFSCAAGDGLIVDDPDDFTAGFLIRQFPVPGIYSYRSMRTGTAGRVVVTNDPLVN